jgi:hypothetical protein
MDLGDEGRIAFDLAMARDPGAPETETEQPAEQPQVEPEPKPEGEGSEAPEAANEDRTRDPVTGKFVAKKPDAEAQPEPDRQPNEAQRGGIPSARLREEADARRAAETRAADFERQLKEMQARLDRMGQAPQPRQPAPAPQPAPNIFENPDAYMQHALGPIADQQTQLIDRFSRLMATQQHGAEAVNTALQDLAREVQTNPAARFEVQRIWQAEHPYGELVAWHKNRQTLKEIGSDPSAYKQSLREQLLNDPEFVKQVIEKANGQARTPANGSRPVNEIDLPPSLATRAGGGANSSRAPADDPAAEFRSMFAR